MAKNLLIVESPAKAKTIEKILGKDFLVKSSFGHIRDLAKDTKTKKAIDIENGYKLSYAVSDGKHKVVKELKEWVKKVDHVWLATDEDREGEAISWHLAKVLNLDIKTTKRIVFREITKPALKKAIQSPRLIDLDLVDAQQARRVLDRLVGFELSGLLWKKVRGKLSAGRVQSVAVRLVADREKEITSFKPTPFFNVFAYFLVKGNSGKMVTLKARLKEKLEDETTAKQFLQTCMGAAYNVNNIHVRPSYRRPAAPFITSTLQQEASRKLGFSVSRTMSAAQGLYEAGHITYMRTDSTKLSEVALKNIADAILQNYGEKYLKTRRYKSKNASAQEAHEAIRPTYIENQSVAGTRDQQRLYELIWKRTIACQMSDAQLEKTTIDIAISTMKNRQFVAEGEVLKFDGFLKVYLESTDDEDNTEEDSGILPPLKMGQALDLKEMQALERWTKPKPRYTEASLVKKMEELGIGRPSTYAPTISKIMDPTRGYVTKETREGKSHDFKWYKMDGAKAKTKNAAAIRLEKKTEVVGTEKNKLFASAIGIHVTNFLIEYFSDVINYNFTADIEGQLDGVSEGKANWVKTVDAIYKPFHQLIEKTTEEADRVTGERILGKDPESGRTVLVRISRFGPVAQIGTTEELGEDEKPKYGNLKKEQSLENITLEEALKLFEYPKTIGEYEGKPVVLGEGRWGPYIKFEKAYVSIPKGMAPHSIRLQDAIELIEAKRKADAPIGYYKDLPITKGSGRFGPFVKWDKFYVSITKKSGFILETITEPQAIELIKAKEEKEANRYVSQWEDRGIAIENGRWGPFIRMGKKNFKLPQKEGKKMTSEQAKELTLEQVIELIEEQGGKVKKPKKTKTKTKK